jgi:hypothetical protein
MADEPRRQRPARPLVGYRDTGDIRHSSRAHMRSWIILAGLMVIYLGFTLVIYFLEPGLR